MKKRLVQFFSGLQLFEFEKNFLQSLFFRLKKVFFSYSLNSPVRKQRESRFRQFGFLELKFNIRNIRSIFISVGERGFKSQIEKNAFRSSREKTFQPKILVFFREAVGEKEKVGGKGSERARLNVCST